MVTEEITREVVLIPYSYCNVFMPQSNFLPKLRCKKKNVNQQIVK